MAWGISAVSNSERDRLVLHVAPTPFFADRGCHMRIAGIVRCLNAIGYRNTVCTYHHGRNVEDITTVRTYPIPGYTRTSAGHSPFKYLADVLLALLVCYQVIRYKPTVIHGHLHEGALLGHVARSLVFWRRIPLVFDVQGSLVGELVAYGTLKEGSFSYRVFRAIESIVCRLPDVLMCSSENSLGVMRDRYGVQPSRLMLTPDGTDVAQFSVERSHELSASMGLPADRPIAVFSGSLLAAKGIDELKALIGGAAKQALAVHFLVIGYPESEMREWVDANGYTSTVTLTGQLPFEKLPAYLALADVAIEPKAVFAGEASGKLVNYMAAGLPVICFESPHNRAMLGDDGYYASLAGRDLLPALREALEEDVEHRRMRGLRCRRRALENYSWGATAARIASRYESLVGEHSSR